MLHEKIASRMASEILHAKKLAEQLRHQRGAKKDDLHQLRVSLRKIEASAKILKEAQNLKQAKRILKKTGKFRDEEVIPKVLHPKAQPPASHTEPQLKTILEENTLTDLKHETPTVKDKKFIKQAKALIKKRRKRLKAMASKLKKHKDDPRFLHHFRIQTKRLRYILDLLEPELKAGPQRLKDHLRKSQNAFGELHDLDRAMESLQNPSPALLKRIRRQRSKSLKHALKKRASSRKRNLKLDFRPQGRNQRKNMRITEFGSFDLRRSEIKKIILTGSEIGAQESRSVKIRASKRGV